MRSIICISAMAALFATAALAGDIRPGCYHRDYSASHLAKHPAQVVDWITLRVETDGEGLTHARMLVGTANQGHAKRAGQGGQVFRQWLSCWVDRSTALCGVDCDGGTFRVVKQSSKSLTFQTGHLMVGETEDCGGAVDLAEVPGQMVRYRLDVVSDAACDGL